MWHISPLLSLFTFIYFFLFCHHVSVETQKAAGHLFLSKTNRKCLCNNSTQLSRCCHSPVLHHNICPMRTNIKHYKREGSRHVSLVFHHLTKQHLYSQTKGDWIIPLERRGAGGLLCTMIHQGEPLWLFQRLSEAGLFFILPDGQLNDRSFLSFSIFSILLTPPLFFTFHLSFNLSPSKDHLLIYSLTFQEPLFFWCNEEHFRSVTRG